MIAFYHKKQQEAEKLAAEDDDAYLHSSWADPKALKAAFTAEGLLLREHAGSSAFLVAVLPLLFRLRSVVGCEDRTARRKVSGAMKKDGGGGRGEVAGDG
eukprot:scaffold105167_cov30-Tisochrysis_lutea.AAC.1